jgi:hypothetical protein
MGRACNAIRLIASWISLPSRTAVEARTNEAILGLKQLTQTSGELGALWQISGQLLG